MSPDRRVITPNGLEATHVGHESSPWLFVGLGSLVHRGIGAWGEAPETMVEYGGEFVSIDWPYDGFDEGDIDHMAGYIAAISTSRHLVFVTLSFGDVVARRLCSWHQFANVLDIRVINIMGVTEYGYIHRVIRALLSLLCHLPDSPWIFRILANIAYLLHIGVNPFHQDLTPQEIHHHREAVRSGVNVGIKYRIKYMKQYGECISEKAYLRDFDALWSPLDLIFTHPEHNALRSAALWRVKLSRAQIHKLSDGAHAAIVERGEIFEKAFVHILERYGLYKKKTLQDRVWSGE